MFADDVPEDRPLSALQRRLLGKCSAPVRAICRVFGFATRSVSIWRLFARHFGVRIETRSERTFMRYTLLLYYPEPTAEELGAEALAEGMRAFQAYAEALDGAGVLASAEVLQQSNATTTVTLAGGELVVQDGPFADTKEQLGGTFVIDVGDLDAAMEWARLAPSVSWGHVEIRPTATRFVDGSWQGAQPVK
jgi:hypothetical protein